MKKALLFTLLMPLLMMAQELTKNPETSLYEYSHVKTFEIPAADLLNNFKNKMTELNYTNVIVEDNKITGSNFMSFLILSTPVLINYQTIIELKENKYRLLINRFVADDKRYSQIPIEDLKSYTKKWVGKINEKLPSVVQAIESPKKDW